MKKDPDETEKKEIPVRGFRGRKRVLNKEKEFGFRNGGRTARTGENN
jgi:hypothetical protein